MKGICLVLVALVLSSCALKSEKCKEDYVMDLVSFYPERQVIDMRLSDYESKILACSSVDPRKSDKKTCLNLDLCLDWFQGAKEAILDSDDLAYRMIDYLKSPESYCGESDSSSYDDHIARLQRIINISKTQQLILDRDIRRIKSSLTRCSSEKQ